MRQAAGIPRRGPRRGGAVMPRLVRSLPARKASSNRLWLVQRWGLPFTAAATIATVIFSMGTYTASRPSSAMDGPTSAGRSLFSSPKNRGGISIGRVLQDESSAVTTPVVQYETKLQLFMCNPSLVKEGNDAYLVDEETLAAALSNIAGLRQADTGEITVAISTGSAEAAANSYMCDTDGKLQWHAQIKYTTADAAARGTTPAVMAAHANDFVAYSTTEFKTALAANINDAYPNKAKPVELLPADIVVPTVGWTVVFSAEESTPQSTSTTRSSGGLATGLGSDSGVWVWWGWLLYVLLVMCCLAPLCCFLRRRRQDDKNATKERFDATRKGRGEEGLSKIRGPEWGITELDFDANCNASENQEMKREYDSAGRGVEPAVYKQSHRAGQPSASAQAWMQQAGKKSAWTSQLSGNSSRQGGGQQSVVRRFDIDDEDNDDGVGQLRSKHPQYSFDVGGGSSD